MFMHLKSNSTVSTTTPKASPEGTTSPEVNAVKIQVTYNNYTNKWETNDPELTKVLNEKIPNPVSGADADKAMDIITEYRDKKMDEYLALNNPDPDTEDEDNELEEPDEDCDGCEHYEECWGTEDTEDTEDTKDTNEDDEFSADYYRELKESYDLFDTSEIEKQEDFKTIIKETKKILKYLAQNHQDNCCISFSDKNAVKLYDAEDNLVDCDKLGINLKAFNKLQYTDVKSGAVIVNDLWIKAYTDYMWERGFDCEYLMDEIFLSFEEED